VESTEAIGFPTSDKDTSRPDDQRLISESTDSIAITTFSQTPKLDKKSFIYREHGEDAYVIQEKPSDIHDDDDHHYRNRPIETESLDLIETPKTKNPSRFFTIFPLHINMNTKTTITTTISNTNVNVNGMPCSPVITSTIPGPTIHQPIETPVIDPFSTTSSSAAEVLSLSDINTNLIPNSITTIATISAMNSNQEEMNSSNPILFDPLLLSYNENPLNSSLTNSLSSSVNSSIGNAILISFPISFKLPPGIDTLEGSRQLDLLNYDEETYTTDLDSTLRKASNNINNIGNTRNNDDDNNHENRVKITSSVGNIPIENKSESESITNVIQGHVNINANANVNVKINNVLPNLADHHDYMTARKRFKKAIRMVTITKHWEKDTLNSNHHDGQSHSADYPYPVLPSLSSTSFSSSFSSSFSESSNSTFETAPSSASSIAMATRDKEGSSTAADKIVTQVILEKDELMDH